MQTLRHAFAVRTLGTVVLLSGLLAMAGCAAQQGVGEPVGGDKKSAVTLRFAWPEGLKARVRTTSVKSQNLGQLARLQDMVATYTMTATRAENGVAVSFDDFQIERAGTPEEDHAVERVLAYRPGFVVDAKGQLIEVIGLDTLGELLLPLQERLKAAQSERESQELQAVAQAVTSENYLKARAGTEWSNMIGTWIDRTLTPGSPENKTEESGLSGVVEAPVPTDVQVSISRIDACVRGQARDCVRLRLTRQPREAELREALRPNIGKMLGVEDWGPGGTPELRKVVATAQLIVDTEPDTLVPHRVEALRIFSLEMERADGTVQIRDSNRTTSTYSYE